MTKNEFVKFLGKKINMPQDKTKEFLNATLDAIVEVLKSGDKVLFTDFGSFYVSHRVKRKGRNPQTGKDITIPAFKLPAFRTGAPFKNALNEQPKPKKENKEQKKQKVVEEDENLNRFYENQDTNKTKTNKTNKKNKK
ncbi:MAG: HU family DNA-binding protein [Desulfurella sp.]